MPTPSPAHLVTALHDWGCDPVARPGWDTHHRDGPWDPVGVLHHHTTGGDALTNPATQAATRHTLWDGRSDLPGPLCHLSPCVDAATGRARVWLIGYGRTNHAGLGSSLVADLIRSGAYQGQRPGPDDTDGNTLLWGLEYVHPGDRTRWPDALLDVGHRAACAICEATGWPRDQWPGRQAEHREWTRRKVDRSWTGDVRAAIRTVMEGADMELDDKVKLTPSRAEALNLTRAANNRLTPSQTVPVEQLLMWGGARGSQILDAVRQVLALERQQSATLAALTQTVRLLASGQTLTADEILAAARAGAEQAIADGVDVRVTFGDDT